jgi:hypothetical protein
VNRSLSKITEEQKEKILSILKKWWDELI